jgi:hypothetical protein
VVLGQVSNFKIDRFGIVHGVDMFNTVNHNGSLKQPFKVDLDFRF